MTPNFGFGNITETSASSESQFNDLKNRVFKHITLPIRIDRFLTTHINENSDKEVERDFQIEGENVQSDVEEILQIHGEPDMQTDNAGKTLVEGLSIIEKIDRNINQLITTMQYDEEHACFVCKNGHMPTGAHRCTLCNKSVHIIDGCSYALSEEEEGYGEKRLCQKCFKIKTSYVELNSEENWRGETISKAKKRQNYLQKDPTVMYYNDSSKTKSPVIGIIKNRNRSSLKSVQIGSKNLIISNTCAFDSIVHVLCTSCCESKIYSDFINSNTSFLLFNLVSNILKNGINVQTYRKRILIMKDICKLQELPEKLYCIQADSTIEVMTRKLLGNWPSRTENQNCIKCPQQKINQQPILIYLNDIQNLDKMFSIDGNLNKCYNCNRRLTNSYK